MTNIAEAKDTLPVVELEPADQEWLAAFGVDSTWQTDNSLRHAVDATVRIGSHRLDGMGPGAGVSPQEVVAARKQFLEFLGIEQAVIDKALRLHPRLLPIATMIEAQREMHTLQINSPKIAQRFPAIFGYSASNLEESAASLEAMGLEASAVINAAPSIVGLSANQLADKLACLTEVGLDSEKVVGKNAAVLGQARPAIERKVRVLQEIGVDPVRAINSAPRILGYASETIRNRARNLDALGLDAATIIQKQPSALGFGKKAVKAKMDALEDLGLDPVRMISALPATLGYSSKSVSEKVRQLDESTRLLRWEYTTQELLEVFPSIIGYNSKKLAILSRIAGAYLSAANRSEPPESVRPALITPLEQYIIALTKGGIKPDGSLSIKELRNHALVHKELGREERRKQALGAAATGGLGRIGLMYIDYRRNPLGS